MTFCRTLALSAAAGAFLLSGVALAAGITVHDARDRDVIIADPARIVSIGGAITEILYALGFEDRLAGVDTTSLYPAAARDKPNVGYMRQLSAEGNHGRAGSGQGAAGAGARNLFGSRPARQDQAGRPRHGRGQAGRVPDGGRDGRSGATARAARQGNEAGPRDVRDVSAQRPGDGCGPEDR